MTATARMTADDYFAVSTEGDRTQLIDGVMVVNEPNTFLHNYPQVRLITDLRVWADAAPGRGLVSTPADVVVDEHNVFGPDVLWIPEERKPTRAHPRMRGLPALAVEVRSPSTWRYDIGKKKNAYERAGLAELWLVDTKAETVLVYRRSAPDAPGFDVELELGAEDELASPQLPGFSVRIEALFPPA